MFKKIIIIGITCFLNFSIAMTKNIIVDSIKIENSLGIFDYYRGDNFLSNKNNYKPTNTFSWSIGSVYSFDKRDYSQMLGEIYKQSKGYGITSNFNYSWYNYRAELGVNFLTFKYYNLGMFDVARPNRVFQMSYFYNHLYMIRLEKRLLGLLGVTINRTPRMYKNGIGGIIGLEFNMNRNMSLDLRYELSTATNHLQLSLNFTI